jgi:signal transduction histidine kinase
VKTRLDDGAVAFVDRNALRQIVLNLLDNAVKYGPPGQTVTIGARAVGDSVRFWMEDQGPGIPPDERERIFEPYHRLRRDAESAVGGSGIGLAVVHDLVTLHRGRVWAEPGTERGTRFVVELPVHGPDGEAERASSSPLLTTMPEEQRA